MPGSSGLCGKAGAPCGSRAGWGLLSSDGQRLSSLPIGATSPLERLRPRSEEGPEPSPVATASPQPAEREAQAPLTGQLELPKTEDVGPVLERLDEEGIGDTQDDIRPGGHGSSGISKGGKRRFLSVGQARSPAPSQPHPKDTYGAWVRVVYSLNSLSWMVK